MSFRDPQIDIAHRTLDLGVGSLSSCFVICLSDVEVNVNLVNQFKLFRLVFGVVELGSKTNVADTSRQLVRNIGVFGVIQRYELVASVDLSQVRGHQVTLGTLSNDHARECNDGSLNDDVEMHFTGGLLHFAGLICGCFACSIKDRLHFAKLDTKLHDLAERLSDKVDLERASAKEYRRIMTRVRLRLGIEGLVPEVGQFIALNGYELSERRLLVDTLIDVIDEAEVAEPSSDMHSFAHQEDTNLGRAQA